MGINLGDIIVEPDGDIYGEGVNVAARLEQLAEPGGICISGPVHDQVEGKVPVAVREPGRAAGQEHRAPGESLRAFRERLRARASAKPLPLPDKPSIAVLPFTNMSGDPEQEYFADGIVEDIITALSRFKWLLVIARNSTFTYKGRAVDVKQVGRELGVRYLLEGSLRKASSRVRVTGQLIEAATGRHIWAERYDRDLTDIFELQDEITLSVVTAIEPNVRAAEIARVTLKPTESLDAYDFYLRAKPWFHTFTEEGFLRAVELLRRAISIDPSFSEAWASLADAFGRLHNVRWTSVAEAAQRDACHAAIQAINTDPDNANGFAVGSWAFAILAGDHQQALEFAERAIRLNPNSALVHARCGWALVHIGEQERAIASFEAALRLSPLDPERYIPISGKAAALFYLRHFDEATEWAKMANRLSPEHLISLRYLAAASALSGHLELAQATAKRLLSVEPRASIKLLMQNARHRHAWMLELYADGLRLAGLPE